MELFDKFFSSEVFIGVMIALSFTIFIGILLGGVINNFLEHEGDLVKRQKDLDQNNCDLNKRRETLTKRKQTHA